LYTLGAPGGDTLDLTLYPGADAADPFGLVADDVRGMNASIRAILGVDHPVLAKVSQYFFASSTGKKIRPAMLLLMSHAVNHHVAAVAAAAAAASAAPAHAVAAGIAAPAAFASASASAPAPAAAPLPAAAVFVKQRRLAEITEMIHTASLLHDDVIDVADTRRGLKSVNSAFGNKLAILAGDFLLARASVCLARLRNLPVVELLSTVIEHLVKGEVLQMRAAIAAAVTASSPGPAAASVAALLGDDAALSHVSRAAFDMYVRKTYYKTASLMANSCRAIAMLGGYPADVADAAERYGMHLGMAFQLVDDLLGARRRRRRRRACAARAPAARQRRLVSLPTPPPACLPARRL
jgi:geranylgeranyl pyrophosphate synthase